MAGGGPRGIGNRVVVLVVSPFGVALSEIGWLAAARLAEYGSGELPAWDSVRFWDSVWFGMPNGGPSLYIRK